MSRQGLKDTCYLEMSETISRLGTCRRLKVGCILLSADGKVVGAGYNGAGPGMPHCAPETCGPEHRCLRCAHAETNAVANTSANPHTAYVTHEPCAACTRALILAGVRRIVFKNAYTSMAKEEADARKEWLNHYNVALVPFDAASSGTLIVSGGVQDGQGPVTKAPIMPVFEAAEQELRGPKC